MLDCLANRIFEMGTDITLYAEINNDGQWQPIPEPSITHWSEGKVVPIEPISWGRPYELFTVLAGAATYKVHTVHRKIKTIAEPRGFPEDMNLFYQQAFKGEELDCCNFCHSWLLVQEIIDFDWDNQFVIHEAYVELENTHLFHEDKNFPYNSFPKNGRFAYIQQKDIKLSLVRWKESYREFVGCYEWLIEELLKLGDPKKMRVIFWFDA